MTAAIVVPLSPFIQNQPNLVAAPNSCILLDGALGSLGKPLGPFSECSLNERNSMHMITKLKHSY